MASGSTRDPKRSGSIVELLQADHARLDGLLTRAVERKGLIDAGLYDAFRAGLLRHIGMEEKRLVPALQRFGIPLINAAQLRLDHGALDALLMRPPKAGIIAAIREILTAHNAVEEGPEGLYELANRLPASVVKMVCRALKRAGYQPPEVCPRSNEARMRGVLKAAA
jgi:hypothetical protein